MDSRRGEENGKQADGPNQNRAVIGADYVACGETYLVKANHVM